MKRSFLAIILLHELGAASALTVRASSTSTSTDAVGLEAARAFAPAEAAYETANDAAEHSAPAKTKKNATMQRHVVYTADRVVFSSLLRSMQSLSLHLESPEHFTIHLIVPRKDLQIASDLATCFRQRLQQGGARAVPQVAVHEVLPMRIKADYRDRPDLQGHTAAFARLFIPEYLPDVTRVVYMDADTLVRGDLTELFETNMTAPLAAVEEGTSFQETWGKWFPDLSKHVPNPNERSIFNDGVLLLDLQRWREENIMKDMESWALDAGASVDDQLLFNLEFQVKKHFDALPHEWNDFRVRSTGWPDFGWSDELRPEDPLSHAKILHWTGPKPWNIDHMRDPWMDQYRELWELPGTNMSAKCAFEEVQK